jgi:hypothetical protein
MSIATMSRRLHEMTPEDELIGSLTRERVTLAVRYAGAQALEDIGEARRWLAFALGTDIQDATFVQLSMAFEQRERVEEGDLEFWHGVPNTEANRERLRFGMDNAIEVTVAVLAQRLCSQLGVAA